MKSSFQSELVHSSRHTRDPFLSDNSYLYETLEFPSRTCTTRYPGYIAAVRIFFSNYFAEYTWETFFFFLRCSIGDNLFIKSAKKKKKKERKGKEKVEINFLEKQKKKKSVDSVDNGTNLNFSCCDKVSLTVRTEDKFLI